MVRARRYRCIASTETQFEVRSTITGGEYRVNIDTKTCSCKSWQMTGIPCSHAFFVILSLEKDPQEYTEQFYTLEFYRNTYVNPIFHPLTYVDITAAGPYHQLQDNNDPDDTTVNDSSDSENNLMPPNTRRPPGRPKRRCIRMAARIGNEPSRAEVFASGTDLFTNVAYKMY